MGAETCSCILYIASNCNIVVFMTVWGPKHVVVYYISLVIVILLCSWLYVYIDIHTPQLCVTNLTQRWWHTLRLRLTDARVNQSGKSKSRFLVTNLQKYWSITFEVSGWRYRWKLYFNIYTVEKLYSTIRRSMLFHLHVFIFLQLL